MKMPRRAVLQLSVANVPTNYQKFLSDNISVQPKHCDVESKSMYFLLYAAQKATQAQSILNETKSFFTVICEKCQAEAKISQHETAEHTDFFLVCSQNLIMLFNDKPEKGLTSLKGTNSITSHELK
jgi:hypothetical protein